MVNLMNQTHQTAIIDHGKWRPNRDVLHVYIYIIHIHIMGDSMDIEMPF